MKPRAYSYIRFSSARQSGGDSLRRQTELRNAWLARKGIPLDESLTIKDLGVSAFRGDNLTKGALAGFIQAVEDGRVPKGSYLIIEKLDRFSRFEPDEALPVFTRLLKAGITVVTLEPEREYTAESTRGMQIVELVVQLCLANEESQKRSDRLKAAWQQKKKLAAEKLVTSRLPAWLKLVGGKPAIDRQKTAIVRRIFDLAELGHGSGQIAKQLNKEGVPALSWGTGWHGSSISKLLRCRAVLGEYQPCQNTPQGPKRRVPVGDPIPNYYPAVITLAQWRRVQQALDSRKPARGKVGRNVANLFQGLLLDARDGGPVQVRKIGRAHYLVPSDGMRGLAEKFHFPYLPFEEALLRFLREVKPAELTGDSPRNEWAALSGELAEVERKIELVQDRILAEPDTEALLTVLARLEKERKQLTEALAGCAAEPSNEQLVTDVTGACSLLALLGAAKGEKLLDLRARLKACIRSVVKEVWVLVFPLDEGKGAFAELVFKNGVSRLVFAQTPGKGTAKPWGAWQFDPMYLEELAHSLAEYSTKKRVQAAFAKLVANWQAITPKAVAIRRCKQGELPYLVAKDMGLANSTVYRWVSQES